MRTLALLLFLAGSTQGQRIVPGKGYGFTHEARQQVDSIVKLSIATRLEDLSCISQWGVVDSITVLGKIVAARNVATKADTIVVSRPGTDFCPPWQIPLHTHLFFGEQYLRSTSQPSDDDQHSAALRGTFGIIIIIQADSSWKPRAYP